MTRSAQDKVKTLKAALALHQAGDLPRAEAMYRQVLQRDPIQPDALHYLGLLAHQLGRHDAAVELIGKAIIHNPRNAYYYNNLGEAYRALERNDAAIESYRHALRIDPSLIEANGNLGLLLQEQGKPEEAAECYARVLRAQPDSLEALNNMGILHQERGDHEKAIEHFQRALSLNPMQAEAYNNAGMSWQSLHDNLRATACYESALRLQPDYADAHNNLGSVLKEEGLLDSAEACIRRALELRPNFEEALRNLAVVILRQGRANEAIVANRQMMSLCPDYIEGWRFHFAAMLYATESLNKEWQEACAAFELRYAAPLCKANYSHTNLRDPARRIRIGYVSSDFRSHPVARNLLPLLQNHNRNLFEVMLYDSTAHSDAVTALCKAAADSWCSIRNLKDEAAAEKIRADGVDILVILAGRFDENRPLIAAYQPAPIQVSLHDPATSGLRVMDYLITDGNLSPRDTTEYFSERLIRLPTFYVHAPILDAPEVGPLPVQQKGYITFGSFNNPSKINESVVALWARVLNAVPDSRIVLKFQNVFDNESVRARYLKGFATHGVGQTRIDFGGAKEALSNHLARYQDIDIALDPFPFTGSTTTFEALWMGAPVITLAGESMVSRWSTAMLKKVKLDELIAHSEDEYVAIAQRLAGDLEYLSELRTGLRARVELSPLCDERGRTMQIERAYRWMWRKWCVTNPISSQ